MNIDNIKIIIAAHKKYWIPNDNIYIPLCVGADFLTDYSLKDIYYLDNIGDNISFKNKYYCELTGLYWGWKNINCEYLGLVHYRRYFSVKNKLYRLIYGKKESILSGNELSKLLISYDIIVPKKRKYYIETLYNHYAHSHYESHLIETEKIINKLYPEYATSFNNTLNKTYGYMFNMFIMKKTLCDMYCDWLFPILFELEKNINYKDYDEYQGRLFGRISELLFNVWLNYNQYLTKEIPVIYMENINWFLKIKSFLNAKFRHQKYNNSF